MCLRIEIKVFKETSLLTQHVGEGLEDGGTSGWRGQGPHCCPEVVCFPVSERRSLHPGMQPLHSPVLEKFSVVGGGLSWGCPGQCDSESKHWRGGFIELCAHVECLQRGALVATDTTRTARQGVSRLPEARLPLLDIKQQSNQDGTDQACHPHEPTSG